MPIKKYKENIYILLIISIFISAVVETDIYLPSFPDMMYFFGQDEKNIQKILVWNFIALCISCPIYGPISDSYGRKKPLMISLWLFFAGSLITSIFNNFNIVLMGRILQGVGSGGCFTLGTAIIFDVFDKEKAIDAINKINIIMPFLMAAAPILGGYLNQNFGFKANFYTINICVFISLALCITFLKETLKSNLRTPFSLTVTLKNFFQIIRNIDFLKLTILISILYAGFLCFLTSSAILFVIELKVTKSTYPYYQSSLLITYLIASLYSTKLIQK